MKPSTPETAPVAAPPAVPQFPANIPASARSPPPAALSGIICRGFSISSAINDPVSHAAESKDTSSTRRPHSSATGAATSPRRRNASPIQTAAPTWPGQQHQNHNGQPASREQMLLSHFPAFRPTILMTVMIPSHATANDMKYTGLAANHVPLPAGKQQRPRSEIQHRSESTAGSTSSTSTRP